MRKTLFASTSALLVTVLLAGCGQELMSTPNLDCRPDVNPFENVPPALRSNRVEVLYATDRVPVARRKHGLEYGCERSKSLAFGVCEVEIGRDLPWEELVSVSRSRNRSRSLTIAVRDIREEGRFPEATGQVVLENGKLAEDPKVTAGRAESEERLRKMLSRSLQQTKLKKAFVYVHGFNNTFDYAACVMAQLWHFGGRVGLPILYSWPAGSTEGALGGYTHDRESGEFTGYHLKQFLKVLASCPELEKIHLIAHSRGTDVLMTALRELNIEYRAAGKSTRSELKLGHVVLAAADLDMEVVTQRIGAEGLLLVPEQLTVYVSTTDMAIGFAQKLFASKRRVGQLHYSDLSPQMRAALALTPQIQVIDAQVSAGLIGHDYFFASPAISSDLILLLRDNHKAGTPNGRPLIKLQENFWEIRDGYPDLPAR